MLHKIVIFNDHLSGIAEKYLKKGSKIYLEGKDSAIGESIGTDISTVEKSGKVNKNDVNMVIKGEMSRFRTCYQREYAKNPELAGKVTLRFMINKEGKVEGAEIKESSLKNVLVEIGSGYDWTD